MPIFTVLAVEYHFNRELLCLWDFHCPFNYLFGHLKKKIRVFYFLIYIEGWLKRFDQNGESEYGIGIQKIGVRCKKILLRIIFYHVNVALIYVFPNKHERPLPMALFHFNVSQICLISSILSLIAIRVLSCQLECIFQVLLLSYVGSARAGMHLIH